MTPRRTTLAATALLLALGAGSAAAAKPGAPAAPDRRARVLETITIEGQIEAPQVQFITSRDRQRFADDAGRRYRPGLDGALARLRAPARLRIAAPPGGPPFSSIEMY